MGRIVRKRWLTRVIALVVIGVTAGLPLVPRGTALAHPLGNFTVNRYARVELYSDAVHVQYVVDMAEIPTFQALPGIDWDGDGAASETELAEYARKEGARLLANVRLSIGGKDAELRLAESQAELSPGQGGLQVARVAAVFAASLPAGIEGDATVSFSDSNFSDRVGWKEIVVRPSAGAEVSVAPALLLDTSDALRSYPEESLKSAPDVREASFTWRVGTGESAPAVAAIEAGGAGRSSSGFSSLLEREQSAGILLLSLLAAFGFGALHALGPGHGKTVVAAYLVGSKGTPRHAIALGLTVTATHTSTVYLLGFVTLSASTFILPETLYLYLGIASGAMVVVMGASLLAGRLWRMRRGGAEGAHRHGLFGKAHSHLPEEHHIHDHGSEGEHVHHEAAGRVTWRSLLTLGVAGGMIPCPSAIVVMLTAISLGQVAFGMLLIVAFSLGLAGVLTAIGIALTVGKRVSSRAGAARLLARPALARLASAVPLLSAAGVTLAGLAITYQAWNQPGL